MNHATALGLLDENRDHELTPELTADLKTHLSSCEDCRLAAQRKERLARFLFPVLDVSPSETFVSNVMRKVRSEGSSSPTPSPWFFFGHSLAPALETAVIVLFFVFLIRSGPQTSVSLDDLLLSQTSVSGHTQYLYQSEPTTSEQLLAWE